MIWYENRGTSVATGVVITENYDPDFIFITSNPLPTTPNNIWNIGNLNPGQKGYITIIGKVKENLTTSKVLVNRVTIDSNETEPYTTTLNTNVNYPILTLTKQHLLLLMFDRIKSE